MSIAISNKHIQIQFVDDEGAITMASASTLGGSGTKNIASAGLVGRRAAEAAMEKGIRNVVVDRGGHKFHGRLRAIVDAAIEAGLRTETKHIGKGPSFAGASAVVPPELWRDKTAGKQDGQSKEEK